MASLFVHSINFSIQIKIHLTINVKTSKKKIFNEVNIYLSIIMSCKGKIVDFFMRIRKFSKNIRDIFVQIL